MNTCFEDKNEDKPEIDNPKKNIPKLSVTSMEKPAEEKRKDSVALKEEMINKEKEEEIRRLEEIKRDSLALKADMMNREVEEFKKVNDEEMEKEIETTRKTHMNDIDGEDFFYIFFLFYY